MTPCILTGKVTVAPIELELNSAQYVCVCVCVRLRARVCLCRYVSLCVHVRVSLSLSLSLCVCVYVCMYVCMCMCGIRSRASALTCGYNSARAITAVRLCIACTKINARLTYPYCAHFVRMWAVFAGASSCLSCSRTCTRPHGSSDKRRHRQRVTWMLSLIPI